jgi:hypothetical protein
VTASETVSEIGSTRRCSRNSRKWSVARVSQDDSSAMNDTHWQYNRNSRLILGKTIILQQKGSLGKKQSSQKCTIWWTYRMITAAELKQVATEDVRRNRLICNDSIRGVEAVRSKHPSGTYLTPPRVYSCSMHGTGGLGSGEAANHPPTMDLTSGMMQAWRIDEKKFTVPTGISDPSLSTGRRLQHGLNGMRTRRAKRW